MALAGKNVVVEISVDDTTYYTIQELNDMTMTFDGDNIDVTEFGDDFINRIQGLKDGTYSLAGFYAPGDTNGQIAIRTAWLNDSLLYVQILPDGTNGFKQEVKCATFEVSASVDGAVELSIELEGTDVVSIV